MTQKQFSKIMVAARILLRQAGICADVRSVNLANTGGNNRIYRIETPKSFYALKEYFRHVGDLRDRLGTEFAFLTYAHAVAPGTVSRPIAMDRQMGIALYEFVVGEPVLPDTISENEVDGAIEFFVALNDPEKRAKALSLQVASEACFSLEEHLQTIARRIDQLLDAVPSGPEINNERHQIEELADRWQSIQGWVRTEAHSLGWKTDDVLMQEQRCVSPSDFGFHNALRTSQGLRFLDFEYAGWDDPAKTANDFFSQLAVPVPARYFDHFVAGIACLFADPGMVAMRARLLRPVYQIKWCCIALNVFLPVHMARRKFANLGLDEVKLKQEQLVKAKKILQTIQGPCHGLH